MHLADLLEGSGANLVTGDNRLSVTGICDDSRRVTEGCVFIARRGTQGHGRSYIREALQRGAAAVITDGPPSDSECGPGDRPVAWACTDRIDPAFVGRLADRFFGHPSRKLRIIGVTGTNGKTTTAFLIRHLLSEAGYRCGLISTVWIDDGEQRRAADLTTPGPVDLARDLARMVEKHCRYAVIEMSSHALVQGRASAIRFHAGVFTNLTAEHLDYHGTMDAYADAKAMLFESLPADGWAVLNMDDPHAEHMEMAGRARPLRCRLNGSMDDEIDCSATILDLAADFTATRLTGPWGSINVRLPLVGRHNVMNALEATAAVHALTDVSRTLKQSLARCPAVPGRLETVRIRDQATVPTVLVDYAHTHEALESALIAVRPLTRGRLIVVFGCGGDRDPSKRPKMAAVACRLADRVVITSDNPRTADPSAIIREILQGVPRSERHRVVQEIDRRRAIVAAIGSAAEEDLVLIAGKGHEDYQIVGTDKHHFDDREVAAEALGRTPWPKQTNPV